jgi:hypothetical protein
MSRHRIYAMILGPTCACGMSLGRANCHHLPSAIGAQCC